MPTVVAILMIWLVGSWPVAIVVGKLLRLRAQRHRIDDVARIEESYWSQVDLNTLAVPAARLEIELAEFGGALPQR